MVLIISSLLIASLSHIQGIAKLISTLKDIEVDMGLLETLRNLKSSRAIHRVAENALASKDKLDESKEESGYLSADNFVRWTQSESPDAKPFSTLLVQLLALQAQVKDKMLGRGSSQKHPPPAHHPQQQQQQQQHTGCKRRNGEGGARHRGGSISERRGERNQQGSNGEIEVATAAPGATGVIFRPR